MTLPYDTPVKHQFLALLRKVDQNKSILPASAVRGR